MNTTRLDRILEQIEKIKEDLVILGVFRPGSLTVQYRKPQEKKGAFYSLSYTHKMKSKTEHIRPEHSKTVHTQIRDYKCFKKLVERWIALGIEYSRLSMKTESQLQTRRRRKRSP